MGRAAPVAVAVAGARRFAIERMARGRASSGRQARCPPHGLSGRSAQQTIFLKHYRCSELWDVGRHLLRASASRREYRKAVELARRSVPTIRPIALGEVLRSGVVGDNFLITEGIPHAVSLQTYVGHWLPQLPPDEQRRLRWKLTRALARICAAAHEAGVFHDDFHGGNVLVASIPVRAARTIRVCRSCSWSTCRAFASPARSTGAAAAKA